MKFIDTHTHLGAPEFEADRDQVVARATSAKVFALITIGAGYGRQAAPDAITLAEKYPQVYASVGIHPNDASEPFDPEFLPKLAGHAKVVAIGETGLDFYRDYATPADQMRWFEHQIEVASNFKKPLVIHSREAGEACLKVILEKGSRLSGGVFHCYAEDEKFAQRLAEIGFLISIPGSVTFKKAEQLRNVVQAVPLSQIMLETDAPFLAPEPHRGKRCESAQMVETAKRIAEVKKISLEEVANVTTENALKLFKISSI